MANKNYPKTIAFSTEIPFNEPLSYMPQHTITSSLTFTINSDDAQVGFGAMVRLVADGTHAPDLSAFALEGPGAWDNTAGAINKCFFYYDGDQICMTITQPGSGGTGGGGGGGTTLNAPIGLTLGIATSTTQPLSWTDTNTSPNESGYKIYRNTVNTFGTATLVTTTAADAISYTVTGLTSDTTYYYWVIAAGNGTTTSDSTAATASGSTASSGPGYLTWAYKNGCTENSNGLLGTLGTGYGRSAQSFTAGDTLEAQHGDASLTSDIAFGLGTNLSPSSHAHINFGIYLQGSGGLYIVESGSFTPIGTYGIGDKFRVVYLNSTTVKYQQWNGSSWTDLLTSSLTPSGAYYTIVQVPDTKLVKEIQKV